MTTLRRLAALNVNIDWLVSGRGTMFVGARPQPSARPGDSFAQILKGLELLLKEHDAEQFSLWSALMAALSRSMDGMRLEHLALHAKLPPTDPRLLEQLAWLQSEGVIGYGKGLYRLIRSSYSLQASGAELQGLLAVRDLVGTILPALRAGVGRGKLMRIAEAPTSGPILERIDELVKMVRRLNDEAIAQPDADKSKTVQLLFAFLVSE